MFPPKTCCKKNQLQYKNSNYQEFTIKGHVDDEHNIVMFVIAQESTLNNHRKRYTNLVPIKNQILDLEDVFYQPTYSNLQKSNIHFLKCYVRHMYMFRDHEPRGRHVLCGVKETFKGQLILLPFHGICITEVIVFNPRKSDELFCSLCKTLSVKFFLQIPKFKSKFNTFPE